MLIEGYNNNLLFSSINFDENFKYHPILNKPNLVTIHTMANLSINHLTENKLPMYFNLNKNIESKFVKVFLKLAKTEFQYKVIKPRLKYLVKHKNSCIG